MASFQSEVDTEAEFWSEFNRISLEVYSDIKQISNDCNNNTQIMSDNKDMESDTNKMKEGKELLLSNKSKAKGLREIISNLQTFATQNVRVLPPYDIKRSQLEISKLSRTLKDDVELVLFPRKSFTFKSRRKGNYNNIQIATHPMLI